MARGMKAAFAFGFSALALAGCAGTTGADGTPAAATAQPARYSARDFFETTAYSLAGSGRYAFSPDGRSILISSDQTGVYNAYRLPSRAAPRAGQPARATMRPRDPLSRTTSACRHPDRGGTELKPSLVSLGDGRPKI